MKNLNLYTSNRLEILADKLAEVLSTPLVSPFEPEIIVVQSRGMERWIAMEIAQRLGICANIRFPFPNAFIYEMIRKVLPEIPESSPFDLPIMTWKIMNLLPSCIDRPGFESIRNYLGVTKSDLKLYQLAERIADTFDQYLLYRPEMILNWERGEEAHWQALLWRKLIRGKENKHRAALGKAFFEIMEKNASDIKGFPQRVSIFGISALPRFHIQIFNAISHFTQVNLFLMNPCQEYWGDIVSDRDVKRAISRMSTRHLASRELYLEKGNSLLASMGTLGRDFFDLILEFDPQDCSLFENPAEQSLLTFIQADILHLRDREKIAQKQPIEATDLSIQLHSCHSPMREIEALHDQLLNLFEQNPNLIPKDILVMTPDIETYAPYIQAVFDLPENDSRRIPFTITDRSYRTESQIIQTFLAMLELSNSRFGASKVLAVLESPAVRNKFDLTESDLELIRRWVSDTRIRWGINAENRRELGLPDLSENTWKAGLDRLLLGYALPGRDEKMFADILPYDHIEGSETTILGKFIDFIDQLFYCVKSVEKARTLREWAETLREILERFFLVDQESEHEIQVIRHALNELPEQQQLSLFEGKVNIQVITCYLKNHLEQAGFGYGFLTGGITFCAMLPMRSIPAKVICLLGMNDDAYPRQSKPLGFDLIVKHPQLGDRSKRNDDRYLFLEAIISAREKLYISYVGQSIQDNSVIPPSVLVSELLDYIELGFTVTDKTIRDHLITKHRLQAFSPEYFKKDKKLFSYSRQNYQAAERLQKPREMLKPFIAQGFSPPGEEWKTITLSDLCGFFANPARFLLNKRSGIYLEEPTSIIEEQESFEIGGLDRYLLEQDLVARKLAGRELKEFFVTAKASGLLPHGVVGESIYDRLSIGAEKFVEKTKPYITDVQLMPLEVDLKISGFNLIGRIDSIYPDQLIHFRYAKVKARDRLKLWIYHLILNYLHVANYPRTSMLVALDPVWTAWQYFPLDNSGAILTKLLQFYWQGLVKPLKFFPETSWEYAHRIVKKNKPSDDALRSAKNTYQGSDYSHGEGEDLYYQLCFKNIDPIDTTFQNVAIQILEPLLENEVKIV